MKDRLRVTEIFRSIQGESTWAGLPCVFVRLTGCPLRCVWCDTSYAFSGGETLSIRKILDRVREHDTTLVQITGGEPLAQPAAPELARQLLDLGFTVLVETSGALDIRALDPRAHRIVDIKCPASGESARNLWSNLEQLGSRDELKFVIANRADFDWARQIIAENRLAERVEAGRLRAILFAPAWDTLPPSELTEWILRENLPVRLQLQLHKFIWDPETRGV